ncbi:oligosaccharide flippase family protein [Enterovibrio sp. Hal110]
MKYKVFSLNLSSLYGMQAILTLFPILIIPLLVKVLGIDGYADYVLIVALFGMFETVVAYSFRTTATREASHVKNDGEMSELISSVTGIRLLLAAFAVLVFFFVIEIFYSSKELEVSGITLSFILAIRLVGFIFTNEWYFQATQNTKVLLVTTFVSRVLFVAYLFLPRDIDLGYVLLGNSIMYTFVGCIVVCYIQRFSGVKFVIPDVGTMITRFKNGKDLFLSSLGVYFYTNINTVFVSSFLSSEFVAVYSVAEKVYRGASSLFAPINRAFYPVLLRFYKENINKFSRVTVNIYTLQLVAAVVVSVGLDYFKMPILQYFLDGQPLTQEAVLFFSHFLYLTILFVVSAFTTYVLIIFNMDKKVKQITVVFGFVNVITVPLVLNFLPFIYVFWAVFIIMLLVSLVQTKECISYLRKAKRSA